MEVNCWASKLHICICQIKIWWLCRHGHSGPQAEELRRWGPHPTRKGCLQQSSQFCHFSTTAASGGPNHGYWICDKDWQHLRRRQKQAQEEEERHSEEEQHKLIPKRNKKWHKQINGVQTDPELWCLNPDVVSKKCGLEHVEKMSKCCWSCFTTWWKY